jgi:cobalt-zinc-cadmium efflux system membrane fusion protein
MTYFKTIKIFILLSAIGLLTAGCSNSSQNEAEHNHDHSSESEHNKNEDGHDHDHDEHNHSENGNESEHDEHADEVHLSEQQFKSLGLKVDVLSRRNIASYVEANGKLEVPPQNEATVTAIIGANITAIKVIEGDKVKKGQALAYVSHPNLIKLQTDYINSRNQLEYLEKEFLRQQKLYEEKVGSGKEFQKIKSEYQSMKGDVLGLEAQLKQIGLRLDKLKEGAIYEQAPIISPINGHIRLVEIKMGQYVEPQTEMFEIVNVEHIHADFMVFEKDMHKVKEGQKIRFSVQSLPNKELEAVIYSVGKSFEEEPKALHIHAEIENKEGLLIPGMYVRGQILTDDVSGIALPEDAIVKEGDSYFIFTAKTEMDGGQTEWAFKPIEVKTGTKSDGWVEIKLLNNLPETTKIAWNNAYYLMAEMKKGEAEHSH